MVGTAGYFERLGSLKCSDNTWLGGVVAARLLPLGLREFATQLEKLVRAPGVELVVFSEDDGVLKTALNSLHSF